MTAIAAVAVAVVLLLVIIGYLVWLIITEQNHSTRTMDELADAIVRADVLTAENATLTNSCLALQGIVTKIAESRDPSEVTDAMLSRWHEPKAAA